MEYLRPVVRVLLLLAAMASAATPATQPIQTGAYRITFDQRSPWSDPFEVGPRMGTGRAVIQQQLSKVEYRLPNESFELYVPPQYDGEEPYGLLVWMSPGNAGHPLPAWKPILDSTKLIWIGPNNAGNDRQPIIRVGLALDAAHNARRRFNINPDRVYVAGLSGGGRISSMAAIAFADQFSGGFYCCGVNYYRELPSREQAPGVFRRSFAAPPARILALARTKVRHVLLTGETDGNREQTKVYADAMRKEGYKFVTYMEVPGMGHAPPDAEWFAKGIATLDADIQKPATRPSSPARGR